ncbi:hypothetical protein MUK42_16079 [Musa troglodytarum]|uniref:Uncharacterized protein n=1 Tax=Musa troglodytarum TaxID=320322 RepID=A0A9E7HNA5_9LILI|nr:hypothetical protein MUK42_16079 [Musa troglodytarum]URE33265.1 hypothetical protein MUK42_16079 [Musa troglodytarum]URE33270.1 hypothetical protein MUK42_16079 [Musa troglodytarum]
METAKGCSSRLLCRFRPTWLSTVCEPNWRICRALLEFAAAEGRDASLLWSRRVSSSTDGGGKDRRRPPALLTTCRRPPQDRLMKCPW